MSVGAGKYAQATRTHIIRFNICMALQLTFSETPLNVKNGSAGLLSTSSTGVATEEAA